MTEIIRKHLYPWARWRNKRFWILILLLLWILFGFFGIPHFAKQALVKAIEDTGRTVEVAEISSNPFALSLTVSGLEIRDSDRTVISRFDEFYTKLSS